MTGGIQSRWIRRGFFLCVLGVLGGESALLRAQMIDPKQMSGIPRPVNDLPSRAVSVRLIRGDLSNNITGFPVDLHVGSKTLTVKTDETGRAQFDDLPVGATAKAIAVVDGERLESEEFPIPANSGIRLMLVATDKTAPKAPAPGGKGADVAPAAPVAGQVSIGGQSRIIIEPGDEAVQVYYLLDVMNSARAPVNPPAAFTFDAPTGAVGTTLLEGSSPKASVNGTHVRVQGPFAPGRTLVQVAYEMPSDSGALQITQRLPARLDQLAVVVKRVGDTRLSSAQLEKQQEMTAEGEVFIAATGGPIPAGQPVVLTLEGMPHHNTAPRWAALSLAIAIIAIGAWAATRPQDRAARAVERKRLLARREKLLGELVRLETDHRAGRGQAARYAARREELVSALEHLYGALDSDDTSPEPAGRAGVAA